MRRRTFIQNSLSGILVTATTGFPYKAFVDDPALTRLTILHTNDVHSRIDPFPMDGGRNQGKAGVARRATLIDRIRASEKHVLLFDSGDIFQGTPYFNLFKGELEIKLMSKLGYDASTMGNHDFDAGIEGFHAQMKHASFPFIVSNYDFNNTLLKGKTFPYKIFEVDEIKVGVFGLGIKLDGLVPPDLFGDTVYHDPITTANEHSSLLKNDLGCDFVICLSHLGYKYKSVDQPSDVIVAENSENIDLILGGHTHTFMRQPDGVLNKNAEPVIINQVGFGGILLGQLQVVFEKNKKGRCVTCNNQFVN